MFSSFFSKLKEKTIVAYLTVKDKLSNIKLPKPNPNVEVEWQEGQPIFKEKKKKSKEKK